MKIRRETTATVTLTELEFCEALGLEEGSLATVEVKYEANFHRMGCGANVVTLVFHRYQVQRRQPRPRRR